MSKTNGVRAAVEAELKFDPLVDDADVHVMNVNGEADGYMSIAARYWSPRPA